MKSVHFFFTSLFVLLITLSFGSALAADCASAPVRADNGDYMGCEVVHGSEVYTQATPEEACHQVCDAINEVDELAAESRELDSRAGLAGT